MHFPPGNGYEDTMRMLESFKAKCADSDKQLTGSHHLRGFSSPAGFMAAGGSRISSHSMAGTVGIPSSIGYVAPKQGVVGITRTLAIDFGRHGVNVNCLCPRTTLTTLVSDNYKKAYLDMRAKRIPLGRPSSPDEQANATLFLASAESDYANGLIMNVDDGVFSLFSGYTGFQE